MQSDWVTFQQLQFEQFKQFQEVQFQQFQRFQVKQIETWKARHSGPSGNVDRVPFPMTLGFDELAYPYLAKHLRHLLSVPEPNHPHQVISLPSRHPAEPVFLQSLLADFQLPNTQALSHAHQPHPLTGSHHKPQPEQVPVLALHAAQPPSEEEQHARHLFEEVKESIQEEQHAREVYKEVKDSIRAEQREEQHARHVFNEVKGSIRDEQREEQHARHVFNEVKDSLFHHQQHAHPHGAHQAHSHGAHQPHPHPVQQKPQQTHPVHVNSHQHAPQAHPARQAHTPPSQYAQYHPQTHNHPYGHPHANQAKFPQLGHEDPAAAHSLFDFIARQLNPEREPVQIPVTRERAKPSEAEMSQLEKLKNAYRASHPQSAVPDTKAPSDGDHVQAPSGNVPPPQAEPENPEAHSFHVLETAARDYESVLLELQQAGSDSHACHIAQAKLMKLLLLLDDIHCSEDARPVRKALVTKINQTLDKLEQAKTAIRASESSIPVSSEPEQSEQSAPSSQPSEPVSDAQEAKLEESVPSESNPLDEPSKSSDDQQAEISSGSDGVENIKTESSEAEQNKASSSSESGEVIIEDVPVSE